MAAPKKSDSAQTERELENAASTSDLTTQLEPPSAGLHPAFYIAYGTLLYKNTLLVLLLMHKQDMDCTELERDSLQQMDSHKRAFW